MELNKLRKVVNFARDKGGYSPTWILKGIQCGLLNCITIDNVKFIVLDEKAEKFKMKGE